MELRAPVATAAKAGTGSAEHIQHDSGRASQFCRGDDSVPSPGEGEVENRFG